MKTVGAAEREVWSEAVAAYVLHLMLVWERRHGAGGVLAEEGFVEEDEVCEASSY